MTVTSLFGYPVERVTVELEGLAPIEAGLLAPLGSTYWEPRLDLEGIPAAIAEQERSALDRKIGEVRGVIEDRAKALEEARRMAQEHVRDDPTAVDCPMCASAIREAARALSQAEVELDRLRQEQGNA